jgi:hypothetical protein
MRRKAVSRKGAKKLKQEAQRKSMVASFAPLRETLLLLALIVALFSSACHRNEKQLGVPPGVQATIDAVTADIAAEQDEKIYREAADEWRQAATLDETKEFFKTLRTRLGSIKGRAFHSARGERKSGVQSYIVQYQTTFERAEGMETFTLVERDGRWLLARYFVNSNALR